MAATEIIKDNEPFFEREKTGTNYQNATTVVNNKYVERFFPRL